MYSLATGVFTRKQIHTVVFKKASSAAAGSTNARPVSSLSSEEAKASSAEEVAAVRFLQESLGLKFKEIRRLCKAHDASAGHLVKLYWAGELPEVGIPDQSADEAMASTPTPARIGANTSGRLRVRAASRR
jgi:hypothetical protein